MHRRLLYALVPATALLVATPLRAASWTVSVDGQDRSTEARALEMGGEVLVDLDGLADPLRLAIAREPMRVRIANRAGEIWSGSAGASTLTGASDLALGAMRFGAREWLVAVPAAARLAGVRARIDARSAHVAFETQTEPSSSASASTAASADWA